MSASEFHFRSSPRPQIKCEVILRSTKGPLSKPIECNTQDIGTGGLFAVASEGYEVGERVEVVLYAPSAWEPLVVNAEVRWVKRLEGAEPVGMGIGFTDLTGEQFSALEDLVRSLDFES